METQPTDVTETGRKLANQYSLYDIDILHEHYSCTLDFGVEIGDGLKAQLERQGFKITHEKGTIYTLTHEYQA